jgi:uncharacterized membrane protein YccF (DUF307 family)
VYVRQQYVANVPISEEHALTDFAAYEPPKTIEDLAVPTAAGTLDETPRGTTALTQAAGGAVATINQNIIFEQRKPGPGMVSRTLWYLFVGWWLTGIAIGFAWLCALSVVLLPVAYMVVNKIPTILTLRPRGIATDVTVAADGTIRIATGGALQRPLWQRALWFVVIGWWACGLAMSIAYLLCLTLIALPLGVMLFNRVPAVMTLQRN